MCWLHTYSFALLSTNIQRAQTPFHIICVCTYTQSSIHIEYINYTTTTFSRKNNSNSYMNSANVYVHMQYTVFRRLYYSKTCLKRNLYKLYLITYFWLNFSYNRYNLCVQDYIKKVLCDKVNLRISQ